MDIKNLETFVMVSEMKSFTHAAAMLGYTQSTVSFQIKQLEQELGAPLFERVGHSVTLTSAGEKLLPISHNMIRLSSEASHLAGDQESPQGVVRIAIAESLANWLLGANFSRFHEKFPGIRLKIVSDSTEDMMRILAQNQVDLIYTLDRQLFDHKYEVAFEAPVQMSFVARADHPLSGLESITMEQILSCPLLLTEKDMSYRALLDETLARRGIETVPLVEVGDTHLICELLRQGVGISLLPDYVVRDDLHRGILARLAVQDFEISVWRQLLYYRNKWVSPEMQCVIDFLRNE